jgi:hypothetical protein
MMKIRSMPLMELETEMLARVEEARAELRSARGPVLRTLETQYSGLLTRLADLVLHDVLPPPHPAR